MAYLAVDQGTRDAGIEPPIRPNTRHGSQSAPDVQQRPAGPDIASERDGDLGRHFDGEQVIMLYSVRKGEQWLGQGWAIPDSSPICALPTTGALQAQLDRETNDATTRLENGTITSVRLALSKHKRRRDSNTG